MVELRNDFFHEVSLNDVYHGDFSEIEPNSECPAHNCNGVLKDKREGGCSCNIAPPCSHCTCTNVWCPECDFSYESQA